MDKTIKKIREMIDLIKELNASILSLEASLARVRHIFREEKPTVKNMESEHTNKELN